MSAVDRAIRVAVTALGVAAIALAAATLSTSPETTDSGGGAGTGGEPLGTASPGGTGGTVELPGFFESIAIGLALVAAAIIVWYVVVYPREAFWTAVSRVLVAFAGAAILWFFYTYGDPGWSMSEGSLSTNATANGTGGDTGGPGAGTGANSPLSTPMFYGVLALVAVGVPTLALFVVRLTGDGRTDDAIRPAHEDEAGAEAIASAAGTAADRIESGATATDNEIYRAWTEMTELLAVDRTETTTPGEFERAAVAAGLDRQDVRELTALFETVRYGGEEPTDELADRAVAVFRRLETAADEDAPDESSSSERGPRSDRTDVQEGGRS